MQQTPQTHGKHARNSSAAMPLNVIHRHIVVAISILQQQQRTHRRDKSIAIHELSSLRYCKDKDEFSILIITLTNDRSAVGKTGCGSRATARYLGTCQAFEDAKVTLGSHDTVFFDTSFASIVCPKRIQRLWVRYLLSLIDIHTRGPHIRRPDLLGGR